jgi:adenylate cyclase class 2
MSSNRNLEIEIKLPMDGPWGPIQRKLRSLGFQIAKKRVFEVNVVLDTADLRVRRQGELVRIRRAGKTATLTYKGPATHGVHKSRVEIETTVTDPARLTTILEHLGYAQVFRYEKYRAEYRKLREPGTVTLDQTPIGNYLELEGPTKWIDRTARLLGYGEADYITASYGFLYMTYCEEHGITPGNMVFGELSKKS